MLTARTGWIWPFYSLVSALQYLLLIACVLSTPAQALPTSNTEAKSLAILAFELHDLTLLPATPAELERTQAAQGILAKALQTAGYRIIQVDPILQNQANQGVGYLVAHPEKAAALGKTLQADYVLVGRIQKPSFLFAYLFIQVIEVNTGQQLAELSVEAKGQTLEASHRALLQLASSVQALLPYPKQSLAHTPTVTPSFNAPIYQKTTQKAFTAVIDDLVFAISQHNFRLTEQANIGRAIAEREEKDFPQLTVLHFCNLTYAQALLEKQLASSLQMPCRISVRQVGDQVVIETLLLADNAVQQALIDEINQILQAIVDTGAA
ncbi:Uncharacterized conserved protein, DUF302 family [Thiothrix eikelboomii]|uniref:Uncharacterized conserved protein, DUF302 family n=1 Tax=Thiothrix eikelboomii TaxID=92487 RepID=A0A1T4XNQ5_9GAMM|nr:DUF2380 domain-containing protein [Thiothrix eikelboomii]SKA91210.1 Uncharacterized conserved protein, DUF302 family [Thiothrix eikelboomii]